MSKPDDIPSPFQTRVLWLNAFVFAITAGAICGGALFLLTNILVVRGGPVVGPHLALLGQVFIGYRVTFIGSLTGFAYGAAVGFVLGYVGARLYNSIAGFRDRWSFKEDGRR